MLIITYYYHRWVCCVRTTNVGDVGVRLLWVEIYADDTICKKIFKHTFCRNAMSVGWTVLILKMDLLHGIHNKRFSNFLFFLHHKWSIVSTVQSNLFQFSASKRLRRWYVLSDIMTMSQSAQFKFNTFEQSCAHHLPLTIHNIKDILFGRHLCGLWKIIQKSQQYLA